MGNQETTSGKIFYVNIEKGSARGAGTIEAPMKDIQKAIDSAADGDVIRIAQGNYLGTMDRGWIQIKGKYISLEGGWNDDFTERNPVRYITRIQPSTERHYRSGTADDRVTHKQGCPDHSGRNFLRPGSGTRICQGRPD